MMSVFKYILFSAVLCLSLQTQAQLFKKGKDADDLYNEAVQETKQQHYQKAIQLSLQALEKRPDFTDQELLLGRLYLLTGNYEPARKYVKKVLEKDPLYKDAYLYAINIEISDKKYEEAACYVDEALYHFAGDKDLMLKKLAVLDVAQNFFQGGVYANSLLEKYSGDTTVQKAYTGHFLLAGRYYQLRGNDLLAQQYYEKALMLNPGNTEAKDAITGMYIRSGSYTKAIEQVNAELAANPGSYDLMMRKLGLLQDTHDYAEALNILQAILKRYPNDGKARGMETSLRMEAAAWYANVDPYLLYQGILEKNPGNREALDKVIGMSMSRGAYREALAWINRGLKSAPNDQRLLGLKMDVLESDRKFTEAAALAERLRLGNSSADMRSHFIALKIASGRDYLAQQQYDLALAEFEKALQADPSDTTALDMMANTYISQKDHVHALQVLDKAIASNPDNVRFLIKKSSVLADMGQYDEAAEIAEQLLNKYPSDQKLSANLIDLRLTAGRILLQSEEYDLAAGEFREVIAQSPNNLDALNYLINLEMAVAQPDSALLYANQALQYYPDNKDLLLKKASVLTEMKRYDEANAITYQLMQRYPFTVKYRTAYTEGLLASGNAAMKNNSPDSALTTFKKILAINRKDSMALLYTINTLHTKKEYDSALLYANQGLRYYPTDEIFLQKRATTLELLKMYGPAAVTADSIVLVHNTPANVDYADYLHSKVMKDQFGMYYLHSSYDYTDGKYNIATLEYRHFIKRGSYAARLNYAGRAQGTGLQGEAELYYIHNPKLYSYALATYSNEVAFAKMRLAYSIFKTFKHNIEGELGIRYLNADSSTSISGVASIAKTWKDFWVNFRAYYISQSPKSYTSFNLTTRYYMNRQQDYLSFTAGLGTSPDDRSRLIQFPQLAGLLTRSVGAGYQKTFKYRTTVGLFGTWINQKISTSDYQNQYDIYIMLQRKF
ncbi:tetratricopeptide repeat protein [Chitinophaga oryziterrae]|uniref:Tetratricopeptide repeat protein n=1 Tax=Chitinophaga oryziterrae TaxID=1031224 RepID=A0A6N8J4C2_9BACT|nr:tetratricopeptide repeat protein [Chitinophaga oryziterrae]MVT39754.1 tetratricopeptide repeat protein [Chitinophaga oryziterrae]